MEPTDSVLGGFYILRNKKTKTLLTLYKGSRANGCNIVSWVGSKTFLPNSLWYIERREHGVYSIRNARAGTAVDLHWGIKENGARVHGYQFTPEGETQRWNLIDKGGYYCIRNVGSQTCLHFKDESSENNVPIQCSSFSEGNDNQLWSLDRRSRSANEIHEILQENPILSYLNQEIGLDDQAQYLILPNRLRQTIYSTSGLERCIHRPGIFDFEDYVIKSKDVVTSWGRDNIAIDGYRILFGIVHGSYRSGRCSYNWTLTDDRRAVVFFDAYLGEEHTTVSLEELGFTARVATL